MVARTANREIIAGHTRIQAAKQAGLAEVPVRLLDLSERDAHVMALADNELGADWDADALTEQLSLLEAEERLMAGFSDAEPRELEESELREVDVSAVRDEFWVSIRGPMPEQPEALERVREVLALLPKSEVLIGSTEFDGL